MKVKANFEKYQEMLSLPKPLLVFLLAIALLTVKSLWDFIIFGLPSVCDPE